MVRGTATALGMKSMARDYGHEVALETESRSEPGWRHQGRWDTEAAEVSVRRDW